MRITLDFGQHKESQKPNTEAGPGLGKLLIKKGSDPISPGVEMGSDPFLPHSIDIESPP